MKHCATIILLTVVTIIQVQLILSDRKSRDYVSRYFSRNPNPNPHPNYHFGAKKRRHHHQGKKFQNDIKQREEKTNIPQSPDTDSPLTAREQPMSASQIQEQIKGLQSQLSHLNTQAGKGAEFSNLDLRIKDLEKFIPEQIKLEKKLASGITELKTLMEKVTTDYKEQHGVVEDFQMQIGILELELAKLRGTVGSQSYGTIYIPVAHYT